MALVLVTPPVLRPLSLERVRAYLRLDSSQEDPLLDGLIEAARTQIEGPRGIYELALITQTWDWSVDAFPTCAPYSMNFPLRPVQSVTSVGYAGAEGPLPPEGYQVDLASDPPRLFPPAGSPWPVADVVPNAVTVRFVAGFGLTDIDVPQNITQAMLLMISYWFEYRDQISPAGIDLPRVADVLLRPYWRPYV